MKRPLIGVFVPCVAMLLSGCVVVGASNSGSNSNGSSFLFLLLPAFLIFAMFRLMTRGRRGNSPRQFGTGRFASARDQQGPSVNMLRAELSVLSDDVLRLEPQITLKPEARDDYEAALHRYRVAQMALDASDEPVDLIRVQRVVDEASWSMARARAVLDGRPTPPPPARLQHEGPRGEPAVGVDEGNNPRYVESPASFQSGWFAAGSGLFGGLLMGSFLSDGFGGWVDENEPDGGDWDPTAE